MKTETIATLINYAHNELGKKVLVITPGKKRKMKLLRDMSLDLEVNCQLQ